VIVLLMNLLLRPLRHGCFDAAAVQSTLAVMHEVEIIDTPGDPAEGVLWTNAYNQC
jgi:NitT/TauT family transport system substrate-binding protein